MNLLLQRLRLTELFTSALGVEALLPSRSLKHAQSQG